MHSSNFLKPFLNFPILQDFFSLKFFAKCITMIELSEDEKKIFIPRIERILSLNYSLKETDTDFSILTVLFYIKTNIKTNEKDVKIFDQIETGKKQRPIFEKLYEDKPFRKMTKSKGRLTNPANDEVENSENAPNEKPKTIKKTQNATKKQNKISRKAKAADHSSDEEFHQSNNLTEQTTGSRKTQTRRTRKP